MFLKDVESWIKRGQYVRFFREICPRKKHKPKIGANIGAITGILLRKHNYNFRIDYSIGMKE
jgi:hypothetical protein